MSAAAIEMARVHRRHRCMTRRTRGRCARPIGGKRRTLARGHADGDVKFDNLTDEERRDQTESYLDDELTAYVRAADEAGACAGDNDSDESAEKLRDRVAGDMWVLFIISLILWN